MRGITLLELMVTLAIVGVLASLSAAALGPMRDRYNRRQAAELVAGAVTRARLAARDTGRCYILQVHDGTNPVVDGDRLRVQRRKNAFCDAAPAAGDLEEVEWVRMPGRVQVSSTLGTPEWRQNGRTRDNNDAELRVRTGGQDLFIRISRHGPVCINEATGGTCP